MLGDRLSEAYGLDGPVKAVRGTTWAIANEELSALFGELAGASFGGGLYRVHQPAEVLARTEAVAEYFSAFAGRIICFGSDWLGREFAGDRDRNEASEQLSSCLNPERGRSWNSPQPSDSSTPIC